MKRKYSLTLDPEVVQATKENHDNLSELVTTLLKEFMARSERAKLIEDLVKYEKAAVKRRKRLGLFSDSHRYFL